MSVELGYPLGKSLTGGGGLGGSGVGGQVDDLAGPNPLSIFTPGTVKLWLRADLGGSTASRWNDVSGNGHVYTQATGLNQPALTTSAAFGNRVIYRFDGTNSYMDCLTAAGAWKFLHDGTGCTFYALVHYTALSGADHGNIIGTAAANAPSSSCGVAFGATGGTSSDWNPLVQNGTGAARPVDFTAVGSAFSSTGPHLVRFDLTDSASPKYQAIVDGVVNYSSSTYGGTGLNAGANEAGVMRIGGELSGSNARMAAMDLREIVILNARPTAAQDLEMQAYANAQCMGRQEVAPPPTIASATLAAGYIMSGADYVAESAGKVTTWSSFGGTLHPRNMTQGTASQQPIRTRPGSANGKAGLYFDGTNNQELVDAGLNTDFTFLHSGTGMSTFSVWRVENTGAVGRSLITTQGSTGATNRGVTIKVDGNTGVLDTKVATGAVYEITVLGPTTPIAVTTMQWSSVRYTSGADPDATGNCGSATSATQNEAAGLPSALAPAGALCFGGLSGSTANQFQGWQVAHLIYAGELSDADLTILRDWAVFYWGVTA